MSCDLLQKANRLINLCVWDAGAVRPADVDAYQEGGWAHPDCNRLLWHWQIGERLDGDNVTSNITQRSLGAGLHYQCWYVRESFIVVYRGESLTVSGPGQVLVGVFMGMFWQILSKWKKIVSCLHQEGLVLLYIADCLVLGIFLRSEY